MNEEEGPDAGPARRGGFHTGFIEELRRELGVTAAPVETDQSVIELDDVHLAFDESQVLDGVSFEVGRGEILCILGGSGAGKSTILRLILRLTLPDRGRVLVQGQDVTSLPQDEVHEIREKMGMVFQESALFDSLSVFDNVAFPLREHTRASPTRIRERVDEVLSIVNLDPERVRDLLPAELSGGMKKRVGIARAVVHEPEILLFDEPTSGLDPITTRTINRLVAKLRLELNVTSVVVTHDIRSALQVSNRVALLYDGQICFMGRPEEMLEAEDSYVREFIR